MKSVQDRFLYALKTEKVPSTIIITNGYQIKNAVIDEFDSFVIVVTSENIQRLIFKHSVSSITPTKEISYSQEKENV